MPLSIPADIAYEIHTRKGVAILVDAQDYASFSQRTWGIASGGYAKNDWWDNGKRKTILMHHLVLPKKEGFEIDHINRNPLDNRRVNLRYATHAQNIANSGLRKINTSGYKGVGWSNMQHAWIARFRSNGHVFILGKFDCKSCAADAYNKKASECLGEFFPVNKEICSAH